MFTGIISKTAKVQNVKAQKGGLRVEIENKLKRIKLGESISINGVCSTVVKTGKDFSFQYMPETLKLSNIGSLEKGDMANIEQSMRLGDRLDGHMVLGHVDGRGKIIKIMTEGDSRVLEIIIPTLPSRKVSARQGKGFMKFLVYKGSVAVEGVSLTVANVLKNSFLVKIIPYTLEHTNLGQKKKGDFVNLEFDILAKYTQNANKK